MKLLYYESALVPKSKIVDYLLSLSHPVGQDKAKFFIPFGFSPERWEELAQALKNHAGKHEVKKIEISPVGTYYMIEGELQAMDGRTPFIRVVWFVEPGEEIPRLATAYPIKSPKGKEQP